ncbi:MAG: TolC family protein, partial [Bacteroidota bacterium]
ADLLKENVLLSKQRLERARLNQNYARGNDLAVLRAQTDLNTDSVSLRNLERELSNTKRQLRRSLNVATDYDFSIVSPARPTAVPGYANLRELALANNPQVLLARQGVVMEERQLQMDEAANVPQVSLYGGPSFLRQDFEVNQIRSSQMIGPMAGFSVNYMLADGKKRKRNQAIQRLQVGISQAEAELAAEDVLLTLQNTWNNYQSLVEQLAFEEANLPFYTRNLAQSNINYAAGKVTDTDLRAAQIGLLAAEISIANKEVEVQTTYFQLLQLAGLITNF